MNTNEDLADFQLALQTKSIPSKTLLQKDVSYWERYGEFHSAVIPAAKDSKLCILGKTSTGRLRTWRQRECQPVSHLISTQTYSGGERLKAQSYEAFWLVISTVVLKVVS